MALSGPDVSILLSSVRVIGSLSSVCAAGALMHDHIHVAQMRTLFHELSDDRVLFSRRHNAELVVSWYITGVSAVPFS